MSSQPQLLDHIRVRSRQRGWFPRKVWRVQTTIEICASCCVGRRSAGRLHRPREGGGSGSSAALSGGLLGRRALRPVRALASWALAVPGLSPKICFARLLSLAHQRQVPSAVTGVCFRLRSFLEVPELFFARNYGPGRSAV